MSADHRILLYIQFLYRCFKSLMIQKRTSKLFLPPCFLHLHNLDVNHDIVLKILDRHTTRLQPPHLPSCCIITLFRHCDPEAAIQTFMSQEYVLAFAVGVPTVMQDTGAKTSDFWGRWGLELVDPFSGGTTKAVESVGSLTRCYYRWRILLRERGRRDEN